MIKSICLFTIGGLMSGNLLLKNNTPVIEVPLQPINEEGQVTNTEVETVWVCPYGNTECLNGVNCNNSCYNGNNDSFQGNMHDSNGKNCNNTNNHQNQKGQHHRR